MVARPASLWQRCRDRRGRGRRGLDDARGVFPDGGHRRAAHARDHVRRRTRARRQDRMGGHRRRSRRVCEVPGRDRRSSGRRGGVGEVAFARARGGPRRRRVRTHEPVRAAPRRRGLGRHLARPAARARGLARLRGRSRDARRVSRPPLGGRRPTPRRRRCRDRDRARSPQPRRSRPAVVRRCLLALSASAAGAFRPLRAAARARPRGVRRQDARPGSDRPGASRRSPRLDDRRRPRADSHRHPTAGGGVDRCERAAARPHRGRSLDSAASRA